MNPVRDLQIFNFECYFCKVITLRKATIDDLDLIRYWDTQEHVIAADPEDDWDWENELGRDPNWREQLIAELEGRLIGFIQIIDPELEESHYWGDIGPGKRAIDIWIGKPSDLGKGYGTQMMKQALQRCFKDEQVEEVWIDPLMTNTRAIRFYRRLGFRFYEYRTFGQQSCAVHILKRSDWEI